MRLCGGWRPGGRRFWFLKFLHPRGNDGLHGRNLPRRKPGRPAGEFGFRVRIVSCFPQPCLKLFWWLVRTEITGGYRIRPYGNGKLVALRFVGHTWICPCGPMTSIGPYNQIVSFYIYTKGRRRCRCLPLLFRFIESSFAYFSFKKSRSRKVG